MCCNECPYLGRYFATVDGLIGGKIVPRSGVNLVFHNILGKYNERGSWPVKK